MLSRVKKSVRFNYIKIREYERQPGDNPCASHGAPISLGWEVMNEIIVDIDLFETELGVSRVRREGDQLRLSSKERERLLREIWGYSFKEIMEASMQCLKDKKRRMQTLKRTANRPLYIYDSMMDTVGRWTRRAFRPPNKGVQELVTQTEAQNTSFILSGGLRPLSQKSTRSDSIGSMLFQRLKFEQSISSSGSSRLFTPSKQLRDGDLLIIEMLKSDSRKNLCYCICDPDLPDSPIVFASPGFCKFTGYASAEIEGRNCRFLQGSGTDPKDVERIRVNIKEEKAGSVNLLNYKKDGTPFINQFYITPLRDVEGKLCYFLGVQCEVSKRGPGQAPKNAGWVYAQGST